MLYLIQDPNDHKYALVSDTGAADGWRNSIAELDSSLKLTYGLFGTTPKKSFKASGYCLLATFQNIQDFHNINNLYPELFI